MTDEQMIQLAKDAGFTKAAIMETADMVVVQEYRKYCEENRCGNYDANWGCPPDCGSPQFMEDRIRSYRRALVLQTLDPMAPETAAEDVLRAKQSHIPKARQVIRGIREGGVDTVDRVMLPGGCSFCKECAKKKGRPCSFPEERTSCLSAYGVDVTSMCRSCGMEINWDGTTISYMSVILLDPIDRASIEKSIRKKFHKQLFSRFAKAINEYEMLAPGDKVAVCISGGKDSMLLAKLFQELKKHDKFPFELEFLCMDPGYAPANRKLIEENAQLMGIPITFFSSEIFDSVVEVDKNPCYLCARMRRGHLYAKAKELGCNKIALGHHYDDVIETILMGMLYGAQVQTMMPKLHSTNFEGMELIRPMYLIREEDIQRWRDYNHLHFLQCACRFTERNIRTDENGVSESKRLEIKNLIRKMRENNPFVESNIFRSVENVNLSTVIAYKKDGVVHRFTEDYDRE